GYITPPLRGFWNRLSVHPCGERGSKSGGRGGRIATVGGIRSRSSRFLGAAFPPARRGAKGVSGAGSVGRGADDSARLATGFGADRPRGSPRRVFQALRACSGPVRVGTPWPLFG